MKMRSSTGNNNKKKTAVGFVENGTSFTDASMIDVSNIYHTKY